MSEINFNANADMFGCMAYIKTDYSGSIHQYKVIGRIKSNYYCDVPVKINSEPYIHKSMEDVLLVIHCGISEDTEKIRRVALKDCEKIKNPMDKVVQQLEEEKEIAFLTLANTGDKASVLAYYQVVAYLNKAIQIVKKGGAE